MTCDCFSLKPDGSFSSFPDYDTHKRRVEDSGLFVSVPVGKRYAEVGGIDEYWYECRSCGRIWRLVEPDPPFKGVWQEVTERGAAL